MKQFSLNPKHQKAALILATMSADMRDDIIQYVFTRGHQLQNDLAEDTGTPKPLAIFSRAYVSDEDFPLTFLGYNTAALATLRSTPSDMDFYQTTLVQAFGIPSDMAATLAKRIETRDILGAGADEASRGYWDKMTENISEAVRRTANWSMDVLHMPFENDQDQKYDVDRLFEFKTLGSVVEDLAARVRLMNGQALISRSLGIYLSKVEEETAKAASGDPEHTDDDTALTMAGDIASLAQLSMMGDPNPSIFGSLAPIAAMGRTSARKRFGALHKMSSKHPGIAKAFKALSHPTGKDIIKLATGAGVAALAVKAAKSLSKKKKELKAVGDAYESLHDEYGPGVADAFASGDPGEFMNALTELASEDASTGDAELDSLIAGDVMEEMAATGDADYGDAEIGGLIKRARINAAVKKGVRRQNRVRKKKAKINQSVAESRALAQARSSSRNQYLAPDTTARIAEEDAQMEAEANDPYYDQNGQDESFVDDFS
jgi:hypothetical protein